MVRAVDPTDLDPGFRPAVVADAAFRRRVATSAGHGEPVIIAVEQPNGNVSRHATSVFPEGHPEATGNFHHVERQLKFALWARGGHRVHYAGPRGLFDTLRRHYAEAPTGRFDSATVGEAVYGRPLELVSTTPAEIPAECTPAVPLGRHVDGCRIGFDLGASDRKTAALIDGQVVFSEEVPWNPTVQADPQWHVDRIMESLRRAAEHLPRVDAIGGSSAGVYVDSRVRVSSIFRSVPRALFDTRVRGLFGELQRAWGVPFVVVNDGEVTALAGAMKLGVSRLLGIALGSSEAVGYVTADGGITPWLNELAFAPLDYAPDAPVDEWSGDRGCGGQYLSQQGVSRLLGPAWIEADPEMTLPERLVLAQRLADAEDPRATRLYETLGGYLGYAVAQYAEHYEIEHVLLLGRVMTGTGGDVLLRAARRLLVAEFPGLAARVVLHTVGEQDKRHGQAIAAASLPAIP